MRKYLRCYRLQGIDFLKLLVTLEAYFKFALLIVPNRRKVVKKLIKLILVAAFGITSLVTAPAQAASDSATVNVSITLTSKCIFGAIAPIVFTYTSFQGTASTSTGGTFNMKCTNNLPYKLGFDTAATPAATDAVTDDAVNLAYTLSMSAATGTGTGVDQAYTVNGSMAASQVGNCATLGGSCSNSGATNKTRTVYVVY